VERIQKGIDALGDAQAWLEGFFDNPPSDLMDELIAARLDLERLLAEIVGRPHENAEDLGKVETVQGASSWKHLLVKPEGDSRSEKWEQALGVPRCGCGSPDCVDLDE